MKNLLCAVALLFSSVAPVAHAMGKYEPDMCKVQIFEITSSSSAQINQEDPDVPDFEPRDADADYVAGEEEIALLNFDLPQGCVADLAQLELFTTSTTGLYCNPDDDEDVEPGSVQKSNSRRPAATPRHR